jgi:actin-related protein
MEIKPHIVIDNGSYSMKVGFSNEKVPRSIFRTIIGYPRKPPSFIMSENPEKYWTVGEDALKMEHINIHYPIKSGIIIDWVDMERIWSHIFSEVLEIKPEDYYVVHTESPINTPKNKEKMAEIMFETFNVKGLYIISKTIASIYSTAKIDGLVVDIGNETTYLDPIFNGLSAKGQIKIINYGGDKLKNYLDLSQSKLSLVDAIIDSITSTEINLRDRYLLFENIVVSGSASKIQGMKEYLQQKIQNKTGNYNINISILPQSDIQTWLGANKLAILGEKKWFIYF